MYPNLNFKATIFKKQMSIFLTKEQSFFIDVYSRNGQISCVNYYNRT